MEKWHNSTIKCLRGSPLTVPLNSFFVSMPEPLYKFQLKPNPRIKKNQDSIRAGLCLTIPPEGGALSSVSVADRSAGPGLLDSARSLFSKLNSGSFGAWGRIFLAGLRKKQYAQRNADRRQETERKDKTKILLKKNESPAQINSGVSVLTKIFKLFFQSHAVVWETLLADQSISATRMDR